MLRRSDVFFGVVVKGCVNGSTNPTPAHQAKQQRWQTVANPVQTQQPPKNSPNPTLNTCVPTIPLVFGTFSATPTQPSNSSGGTSNRDDRPRLGPFNGAYPVSPLPPTNGDPGNQNNKSRLAPFNRAYPTPSPPTQPTSSGTLVLQTLNGTNPDPTYTTKSDNAWTELDPPPPSIERPSYASEDSNTSAILVHASRRGRDTSEDADDEDRWNEVVMEDADTESSNSFVYPPPISGPEQIGACGLRGFMKPTSFVDPITDPENEYRSWKHQE